MEKLGKNKYADMEKISYVSYGANKNCTAKNLSLIIDGVRIELYDDVAAEVVKELNAWFGLELGEEEAPFA